MISSLYSVRIGSLPSVYRPVFTPPGDAGNFVILGTITSESLGVGVQSLLKTPRVSPYLPELSHLFDIDRSLVRMPNTI